MADGKYDWRTVTVLEDGPEPIAVQQKVKIMPVDTPYDNVIVVPEDEHRTVKLDELVSK